MADHDDGPLVNVSAGRHLESSSNVHRCRVSIAAGQRGRGRNATATAVRLAEACGSPFGRSLPSGVVLLIGCQTAPIGSPSRRGGSLVPRLLVIEDESGIGTVGSRAMSSARVRIDCAADGRGGLEGACSGHHELVLVDLLRSGPGRGGQRRADRHGRQTAAAGDVPADAEGHGRVDRGPGHHQADREVARS
jgi:hypothetical protein